MARKTGSHSDITRPKVRLAALRLIAQHGYAAVSMRQIAKEVGVQAGALYNYTKDKQTLLFDLLNVHMEELLDARKEAKVAGDARTQLEAFTRFHIQFHLPRSDEVFLSYMELRNLTPENFARIEGLRKTYEDELEAILVLGVDEGVFHIEDTKVATLALIALLTGMTNWYRDGGRLTSERIEEIYWDLVRKSVGVSDVGTR